MYIWIAQPNWSVEMVFFFHWLGNQIEIILLYFSLSFSPPFLSCWFLVSCVTMSNMVHIYLLCSLIACTSVHFPSSRVVVPQGLWTTWLLLFSVNYTPRFILTWSRGWSLLMSLTKGTGAKNRKYNWKWVNSKTLEKGMVSVVKDCMVSCEAFAKYEKCLSYQCWDLLYIILKIILIIWCFPRKEIRDCSS